MLITDRNVLRLIYGREMGMRQSDERPSNRAVEGSSETPLNTMKLHEPERRNSVKRQKSDN